MPRSFKYLFVLAAVVLYSFLAARFYLVSGDDGTYIALARSLQAGEYRAINVPGDPVQTQYPPLFPLLLTPFANLPVGVMRLWVAALSLLALFPIIRAAIIRDPKFGLAAALLFVLSPLYGEYSTSVLTETLFVGIAYAVLTRAARGILDPFLPIGLLAAWYLKSAALALVAAVIVNDLIARRWKSAFATTAIVGIGMAPWWWWQAAHGSDYVRSHILIADIYDLDSPALSFTGILTERIPHNLSRYVGRVVADVMTVPYFRSIAPWTPLFPLKIFASVFLSIIVVVGFFRSRMRIENIYCIFLAGLLLVHPVFADRYLYMMLPSLFGFFALAIPNRKVLIGSAAFLLVGCILAIETPIPPQDAAYYQAVDWIKEHTPEDAVIAARKPAAVWYYTGRKSVGYPSAIADYVIRDDYVIGVHSARKYVDPVFAGAESAFVSDILPDVKVYKVE